MVMMSRIKANMSFDIDKAREQYQKDIKYYYQAGCRDGTDYKPEPENSKPVYGFGDNPIHYCNKQMLIKESDLTENIFILGREVK